MKSVTATSVYNNFMGALGNRQVWCVSPAARTNGIDMHLWRNMGCISIYLGEQSRNINYSGMAMFVKGTAKSANYTGDCRLTQAKSVYDQEAAQGINSNEHVLVAPHHGGDYGASFRHYCLPCNDIAISVGTNNSYRHPQKDMLRYLRSLGSVKRTDVDGDIEVRL
jgi:beta-lactamase superfamily II metal-dependent hydrolase